MTREEASRESLRLPPETFGNELERMEWISRQCTDVLGSSAPADRDPGDGTSGYTPLTPGASSEYTREQLLVENFRLRDELRLLRAEYERRCISLLAAMGNAVSTLKTSVALMEHELKA